MTPVKIHMLSGSIEYLSEPAIDKLAAHLTQRGIATCTISRGHDRGAELPDLDLLDHADVMLVFCKRMMLIEPQLKKIQAWCAAGKPIIGIRTASHAFQTWQEFDKFILGGDYTGHGDDTTTTLQFEHADHPILTGLSPWTRADKIYTNPNLAPDVTVLIRADTSEPLAWVRKNVFYTSMGHPQDFDDARYLALMENVVRYVASS